MILLVSAFTFDFRSAIIKQYIICTITIFSCYFTFVIFCPSFQFSFYTIPFDLISSESSLSESSWFVFYHQFQIISSNFKQSSFHCLVLRLDFHLLHDPPFDICFIFFFVFFFFVFLMILLVLHLLLTFVHHHQTIYHMYHPDLHVLFYLYNILSILSALLLHDPLLIFLYRLHYRQRHYHHHYHHLIIITSLPLLLPCLILMTFSSFSFQ